MSSIPSRPILPTALLALAAAACGGGDARPESESGADLSGELVGG